jgi:hypothetical protein
MNNEPRDKMNKILKELKIHRFMILLHVLRDVIKYYIHNNEI